MLARSFARIAHLNSQKITYYLALEGFFSPTRIELHRPAYPIYIFLCRIHLFELKL